MLLGAPALLRRKFEPADALRTMAEHRCGTLVAVPVMLSRLLELPEEDAARFDWRPRVVAVSGSALPGDLATKFMDRFGDVLYNLYGSTEVSWVSIADPTDLRVDPSTAGKAPFGTKLEILDDDGNPVEPGEIGRVFVSNGMMFEGYTREGSEVETRDGLMTTGDLGRLDSDGRLFLSGRSDSMIVSGGENVYPGPVEDLLASTDEVREVAVVGVDDEKFGQRLAAYIVLNEGASLDADKVRSMVKEKLSRFSVPRDVVFLDELPRNPTGKVLARELPESTESGDSGSSGKSGSSSSKSSGSSRSSSSKSGGSGGSSRSSSSKSSGSGGSSRSSSSKSSGARSASSRSSSSRSSS